MRHIGPPSQITRPTLNTHGHHTSRQGWPGENKEGSRRTPWLGYWDSERSRRRTAAIPIDLAKVIKIKRTLEDKVTTLKDLDEKVLDSIDDEAAIADEIQQSDEYLANIYATLLKAEETLSTRAAPGLSVTTSSASRTQWDCRNSLFILSLVIDKFWGFVQVLRPFQQPTELCRQQIQLSSFLSHCTGTWRCCMSQSFGYKLHWGYDYPGETIWKPATDLQAETSSFRIRPRCAFSIVWLRETHAWLAITRSWSLEELLKAMLMELEARERLVMDPQGLRNPKPRPRVRYLQSSTVARSSYVYPMLAARIGHFAHAQ